MPTNADGSSRWSQWAGACILHGPIYPVSDETAYRSDTRATAPEALTACVGVAVCGSHGTAGGGLFVCLFVQIASIKYEVFTLTNVRACDTHWTGSQGVLLSRKCPEVPLSTPRAP